MQAIAGAGASGERWRGVLDRELEVTRGALARSEESLKAFTRANPAVPDDPRDSLEYRKLADLNDALTKAQSRRMEKEALHKQVTGGNGGLLSQVVSNQVVADGNDTPGLTGLYNGSGADTPWLRLDIDRTKCETLGLSTTEKK